MATTPKPPVPKAPKAKKPEAKKPKKTGRPSKFDSLDLAKVEKLSKAGLTNEQLATACDIDISNWYEWLNKHDAFRESVKDWKGESDKNVERSLYERATGYSCPETKVFSSNGVITTQEVTKYYPPDPTSIIFWLKNRQPENWRDKQVIKIDIPENATPLEKCDIITAAVCKGEITPEAGNATIQGIKDRMAIEDATELKVRIDEIEKALGLSN